MRAFTAVAEASDSPLRVPLVVEADFQSRLEAVARRCGATCPLDEFVYRVSRVYQVAQRQRFPASMAAVFRRTAARPAFCEAIRRAGAALSKRRPRVLVIGCGRGLAGQQSDYAAQAAQEALGQARIAQLLRRDPHLPQLWTVEDASRALGDTGPVDAIIMHSLVHFLLNPAPLLAALHERLTPGGMVVMGHEPNASYWRNQTLAYWRQRLSRERHGMPAWLLYCGRQAFRLKRMFQRHAPNLYDVVNQVLRRRYHWKRNLSRLEINRIVDPHRCQEQNESFRLGWDGIDLDLLGKRCCPGWRLEWHATYDHLGYGSRTDAPPHWLRLEADLAATFPDEGSSLAALWRKAAPGEMTHVAP